MRFPRPPASRAGRAAAFGSSPFKAMATTLAPTAEIPAASSFTYPEPQGRRHHCSSRSSGSAAKPVKKMRFVPAEKAFAIAPLLAGTRLHRLLI